LDIHLQVLQGWNDSLKMAQGQHNLALNFHSILPQQTRWTLPILLTINQELYALAIDADKLLVDRGEKADQLENAARAMNKAFSICATDRFSSLDESRKWGVFGIVNLLFKTYFKVPTIHLTDSFHLLIFVQQF
jgi:hypothetical protein